MKTNLTFKFSFLFVLFVAVVNFSYAQTLFEVTAPASITGSYDYSHPSDWGGDFPSCNDQFEITGEVILVDDMDDDMGMGTTTDACQDVTNDLTGKVALIDRGSCGFSFKALNAQNQGAIAVIICNNIPMDPPPGMAAGPEAGDVTVPTWSVTAETCDLIKGQLTDAIVSIKVSYVPINPGSDEVLWDGGQFNGSLEDWTTNTITVDTADWVWDDDATSDGPFATGYEIASPSACNGAAVFNSAGYNADVSSGPPYPMFTSELISPVIDCSTFDAVSLKFYMHYIGLNGSAYVNFSTDGGNTWSPNIDFETENVLTADETNLVGTEIRRFFLPELAFQPNVRIKITWSGDFYFLLVDDVQLIRPENNNLQVNTNFYAIAPNALTPQSQLEGFSFLADISNIGAETQPNTTLNINIADDGGTSVFSADLDYGDVVADTVVENIPFLDAIHTPSGDPGDIFTGTYSISSDSVDFDESNNSVSFQFGISDSTFAKEFAPDFGVRPADNNWMGANDPHSWAYGCAYHIVNGSEGAGGETVYFAASATFGIEALPAEQIIEAYLYEWSDLNGDGFFDIDERERIAIASYETTGNEEASNFLTLPLEPFNPLNPAGEIGKIDLKDNTTYLLVVEFDTGEIGVDMEVAAADGWEYNAQVFRTDQSVFGDMPYRPSPIIGIGKPSDITFEPSSFANLVPSVRLNLTSDVIISVDELDQANIITVNPNPADEYVNLNMDFVNIQAQVTVNIVDVTGKTVTSNVYDNVSKETFTLNTSNLAVGTYFINILAEEGVRTERMIVQR